MSQLFDAMPDPYEQWFLTPLGAVIKQLELDLIMQLVQPQPGEHILDAGCGSGIFTEPLVTAGASITGIDVSRPMLEWAEKRLPEQQFLAADICDLPFADGHFDKTVSITALEFIEDAQRAMDEMWRVTKPGGLMVVATLNGKSPWAARRKAKAAADKDSLFNHAWFRTPQELAELMSVSGEIHTAIHFEKDADPDTAVQVEAQALANGEDSGAFLIGCWRKP
ncbi:class I SAM-dependent methyltransferase [Aliamphritea spongicola]|uniref:class I SAM-dependent methyltransferase n=1 Tax=Aliamphritea spongicola TaxID=707589 RepID=UPI00196AC41B|nr:methyltransferase domain-containing protein [Aliamphritea spongicola]MBN3561056.1 methyltransferase domain-containing protein [Aliamphritea spongicola]